MSEWIYPRMTVSDPTDIRQILIQHRPDAIAFEAEALEARGKTAADPGPVPVATSGVFGSACLDARLVDVDPVVRKKFRLRQ